jgi:sec-independent protein translocase protein TatC
MMSLPFSVGLFILGVFTCYFIVFPRMLSFFLWTNEWLSVEPDIRLNEWVGFSVVLMLIFGVAFQLPLFMLLLERVGIITHEWIAGQRRMAILILAITSAVVTPGGDPYTMIFLVVPLYLLFELGLLLMLYFRRRNPFAATRSDDSEWAAEI